LNPKIKGFSKDFFCNFGLRHTFKERIAPKWLEIDQDNLHLKFLALNVNFSSLSFNPLCSRRPAQASVKKAYFLKSRYFTAIVRLA